MSEGLETYDVDRLADRLAERLNTSRSEAVKIALENELKRNEDDRRPLRERLQPLFNEIDAMPNVAVVDKAFFDELSGE